MRAEHLYYFNDDYEVTYYVPTSKNYYMEIEAGDSNEITYKW